MKYARFLAGLLSVAVLTACIIAIINRQAIMDWWALRGYVPSAQVVKLADDTTMLADTRRLFYVNRPSLDDKTVFNGHCRTTEQSIVLGCYVSGRGIFLLDVTDPRLSGVIEVTAAHEVLHAAYERLSAKERQNIDDLTASFFATVTDERIKNTVENYRKNDPNVVPNELHSILATEIEALPAELETYYAQYFTDRKKVVAFAKQYEQAFIDLRNQIEQYDAQLEELKAQIDDNQAEITARGNDLNAERGRMDSLLASGRTEEYNAAVAGFNQDVNAYNALVQASRTRVNRYNALVEERNALATEERDLIQAIDSSFTTETRQ